MKTLGGYCILVQKPIKNQLEKLKKIISEIVRNDEIRRFRDLLMLCYEGGRGAAGIYSEFYDKNGWRVFC